MMPLAVVKERLARYALGTQLTPGRGWRPLQDTTDDEIVQGRELPLDWPSWQRAQDYYVEGALIWFDIDTIIRERSNNQRSLDDFARTFFGVDDGRTTPLLYDFDDVVAALERVQPYGWKAYLRARLDELRPAPNDGFGRGGWRLAWTDQESDYAKSLASRYGPGFGYTLGFGVNKSGEITGVLWDGPAFRAGLSGGTLLAVNLHAYEPDVLKAAIKQAKGTTTPIELLVKDGSEYRVVKIDYHDGLRYPTLERIEGRPDLLTAILSPK
jgi:predicted metalloprotease with PDZ domain